MGIVIVTILQFINLLTLLLFFAQLNDRIRILLDNELYERKRLIGFVLTSLLIFANYLRYSKVVTLKKLSIKFDDYSDRKLNATMNKTVYTYLLLSFALFIYIIFIKNH